MKTQFRFCIYLFVMGCTLINFAQAEEKVATVSPISYTLSKTLVQGTGIEVSYLPPTRLPFNRIASWLRKNSTQRFDAFDAFVGISEIKPELDLFPSLRQSNIRIVDIDIANAIMPNGEKVVLADNSQYFWLNSNNLLVMLGILKRDFSALWPQYADKFNQNYQTTAAGIRQINLQLDELLMANDIAFVVPKNTRLLPFVNSLASDTSDKQRAIELELPFLELTSGKAKLARSWHIDDLSRYREDLLIVRLQSQLQDLKTLLDAE